MWLLSDFLTTHYFQGNKRRIELPNALLIGQAEGLCFVGPYRVFVSNERLNNLLTVPQRLYALNTSTWLAPLVPTATAARADDGFSVYPNPARHTLRIERPASGGALRLVLQDLQGRVVATQTLPAGSSTVQEIPVGQLGAGLYVLQVESSAGSFSRKIEIK
jgi:hypothetical protein